MKNSTLLTTKRTLEEKKYMNKVGKLHNNNNNNNNKNISIKATIVET